MRIIGIDPGKTIGLCVYDTDARRVLKAACVTSAQEALEWVQAEYRADDDGMTPVAIERPRIYASRLKDGRVIGGGGNDIADTIEQVGWLVGALGGEMPRPKSPGVYVCPPNMAVDCEVYLLERRAVIGALSAEMGEQVRGDAGVWQALKALHPDAMRRPVAYKPATRHKPAVTPVEGGPLYGVTSHAQQAVAVAWSLARHLEAQP